MEIAGLGRLHPGRLAVAFGHGVEPWMRQIAARPPDRLAALEETVSAVRALLTGSNVSTDGSFVHLDDVQLRHVPDPPPAILIGTTGPRALAAAGRSADGFLLAEGSGPPGRALGAVAGGRGGGDRRLRLAQPRRRPVTRPPRPAAGRGGVAGDEPVPAAVRACGGGRGLTPDRLRAMAVAGNAEDCVAAISALWEAGADSVVVVPRHEDRVAQVARFVGDVLPRLA